MMFDHSFVPAAANGVQDIAYHDKSTQQDRANCIFNETTDNNKVLIHLLISRHKKNQCNLAAPPGCRIQNTNSFVISWL